MKRLNISRTFLAALFTISAFCCGGSITYSPDSDQEALVRISKTWSTTYDNKPFSITLCEDKETNASFNVDGCKYAHLVQSNYPSKEETVSQASGCESCFLGIMTNISAVLKTPDETSIQLNGIVSLGTESSEDPYDGDFALLLYSGEKVFLEGRIQKDGTIILSGEDLYNMGFAVDEAEEKIETFVEADCSPSANNNAPDEGADTHESE